MGINQRRRGYSLLLAIVVVAMAGCGKGDRTSLEEGTASTRKQLTVIREQLAVYRLDLGRYPSTRQGLAALCSPPATETSLAGSALPDSRKRQWHGPYLEKQQLFDAWGNAIRYEHGADQYLLTSDGPDAEPHTADDLTLSSRSDAAARGN